MVILGSFATNLARIRQVGGVSFPLCILSSYRIPSSPIHGWGVGKGNQSAMSSRFLLVKSFLSVSREPEQTPNLSAQLTEVIQAWKVLICKHGGSAAGPPIRLSISKKPRLLPWYISSCLTQCTLLSMVHVSVWLRRGSMGSRHTWIRPNQDIGWKGALTLTTGGLSVPTVAAEGLCASLPACSRGAAWVQSGTKQLEERETV